MARAKAKAKAKELPCPLEPLKPYTPTLNGKFVKAEESQRYWGFPKLILDTVTRTMVPGFEILLDYSNKVPELKKEDLTQVPIDWADYMDPDAMTTLLGDPICNIEEEEYQEACQHALKSLYELRANDEDEEGEAAPGNDDEGSDTESNSSSDNSNNDNGHDDDDSNSNSESNNGEDYDGQYSGNDWGEPPSDREDEDADLFYEEYNDDVEDIEDDVEANRWSDIDSDQYRLINVLEDAREEVGQPNGVDYDDYPNGHPSDQSSITEVSLRFGPRYDKHGREILKLGSYQILNLAH